MIPKDPSSVKGSSTGRRGKPIAGRSTHNPRGEAEKLQGRGHAKQKRDTQCTMHNAQWAGDLQVRQLPCKTPVALIVGREEALLGREGSIVLEKGVSL